MCPVVQKDRLHCLRSIVKFKTRKLQLTTVIYLAQISTHLKVEVQRIIIKEISKFFWTTVAIDKRQIVYSMTELLMNVNSVLYLQIKLIDFDYIVCNPTRVTLVKKQYLAIYISKMQFIIHHKLISTIHLQEILNKSKLQTHYHYWTTADWT